ncbi:ceramide-1-phosphate transfer protein [Agrilus planipennis]|uniref:Ceramide-1-phosphate transfer protein n=1 Tax=Agrilus planipennis TaxID=224129 RepID=A0A1W4XCG5_AGRPL|nr:ceramide-1-phosphate transfer protein [Agrilus planipennis]XP_025833595.1 ceramide-1-phosphate transfer protein [Agrilus planipennis]
MSTNNNSSKLDFEIVLAKFESSLTDEEDTELKAYIEGYEELYKFFTLMGTIFTFVSKDLVSKMEIMNELMSESPEQFRTVKRMIEHEKNNELLTKKGYTSGSRTLLRLHRGLNFIKEFLQGVSGIDDKEGTATVCRKAYEETLAEHHTFLIRNGAKMAMGAMPTREQLLKKIISDDPKDIENVMQTVPKVLVVLNTVFERIDSVYTEHSLHELP